MPKQQRKNAFACSHSCLASQPNVQHLKETKMKQGTMNILFSILKTKLLKNGEAPILMRVTVSCTTRYCSPIRSTDRTPKHLRTRRQGASVANSSMSDAPCFMTCYRMVAGKPPNRNDGKLREVITVHSTIPFLTCGSHFQ